MLKNYFKTTWRNLQRDKFFTFINIIGLSIGISASLVIFLLVHYDFTFDKFEKNGNRIYRVVEENHDNGETSLSNSVPEPLGPATEKEGTGVEWVAPFRTVEARVTVPYPDPNRPLILRKQKDLLYADSRYFGLINYTWLAGSATASLQQPYQVVLTEKNARLYFPGLAWSDIVGKSIAFDDSINATITGVVKDITANTDFDFGAFISLSTLSTSRLKPWEFGLWNSTSPANQLFLRLSPGASALGVTAQLDRLLKKYTPPDPEDHSTTICHLQPLADLHFNTNYGAFTESRQAHKPTLYGLLAVAAFLLLLACINFINLTTAQASQRAKEIGIRKTMGSHRHQLILQFLVETFLLTLMATGLSIALTPILLKIFADFIPPEFHFSLVRQPEIIGFLLALIVIVSLLSGLYPALVLSGYKPLLVLKNQAYADTGKTRSNWLRQSLTVSQFVIAQVFIIATLLVTRQISYALNKDLGFKKDDVVYFRVNYREPAKKKIVLMNMLRELPGIQLISLANNPPSSNGIWTSTLTFNDGKKEMQQNVQVKLADSNYFRLYGFHLLAGTSPPESDTTNAVVINETYAHILGYQRPEQIVGMKITKWNGNPRIVGVVADFHQRSLREPIRPLVIANGTAGAGTFNIALQPQLAGSSTWTTTIAGIEKAFKSVYPNDDFDYQFVDESIAKFYTAEKNTARLLIWCTGLTIFISCLGLLGLVIYITNRHTKEIGIRKIVGASVAQIIFLLSSDFLKLIAWAFLITVPVAWWGAHAWLDNFAYRTSLSWWIFLAGGAMMGGIAIVILLLRTFRAANANPADSLRTE